MILFLNSNFNETLSRTNYFLVNIEILLIDFKTLMVSIIKLLFQFHVKILNTTKSYIVNNKQFYT